MYRTAYTHTREGETETERERLSVQVREERTACRSAVWWPPLFLGVSTRAHTMHTMRQHDYAGGSRVSARLEHESDALAAADAGRAHSNLGLAACDGVGEAGGDARAGGAERMAEGDGAAEDVDFGHVEAESLVDRWVDGCGTGG